MILWSKWQSLFQRLEKIREVKYIAGDVSNGPFAVISEQKRIIDHICQRNGSVYFFGH